MSDSDLFETTSEAETAGIRVHVRAQFSPEHSSPSSSRWFFLYTIRISNESGTTVQLLNRHWTIVDGTGHTEEVHGPGVVGEQPTLQPGHAFEYTSGCPLPTPFGSMAGTFDMQRSDGTQFEAEVALFQLIQPGSIH
ncbi:MAG: Co2+/Mg2+ efflux protein ApaG [Deltaproteobacteria bacterium]|nr:Co2+/Mg2+ efflux protein ApaG [Deltaproteobacteria bacterium]